MKDWWTKFLTEKGWYNDMENDLLLDGAKDKDYHIGLTVEMMIDFIIGSGQNDKIKTKFIQLDFANADCMDFWKHLTNGMMLSQGYDKQYETKFGF